MAQQLDYNESWFTNPMMIRNDISAYRMRLPGDGTVVSFLDDNGDFNKPGMKVLESRDGTSAGIRAHFASHDESGATGNMNLSWVQQQQGNSGGGRWVGTYTITRTAPPGEEKGRCEVMFTNDGTAVVQWEGNVSGTTAIRKKEDM